MTTVSLRTGLLLLVASLLPLPMTTTAAELPSRTELDGLRASLPQRARFLAVDEATPPAPWLEIVGDAPSARPARVEWIVRAPDGAESAPRTAELAPSPDGHRRVALPSEDFRRFGLYELRFRVIEAGRESPWASDRLAVYAKNSPAPRALSVFPIGFATGAPRATPRMLELAASLGFEYHRFNAVWQDVQPREGVWHWNGLDRHLELVERHGMRWHAMTSGSTKWAAEDRMAPPRLDAWRAWISALAERYADRIEFWEIWNEPNIQFFTGTVEEYGELQRAAYDEIKAVAPQVIVTSGGYAGMNHARSKPGAFEAALRDYPRAYDWFAYHMHDTFPQFHADIERQLGGLKRRLGIGELPLVFTETGFDTRFGERFQAETLVKKMAYASAIGAKRYTWYNLIDRSGRDAPNKPGFTFGLITNPTGTGDFASIEEEFRPKLSFPAATIAIRELRDRAHAETWASDGRRFAFLYGPVSDRLLIAWSEGKRLPAALWVVETDAPRTESLDLFGNVSPLASVDGLVVVPLDDPRYHRFVGGTRAPRLVGPLVVAPEQITPAADGLVRVELELRNPLRDRALTARATVRGDGFEVVSAPAPREIAAGADAWLPFTLRVAEGALGETRDFVVDFAFDGLPWAPSLRVPVSFNTIDAVRGHTVVVDDLQRATNKNDHDPHSQHLQWGSPVDLSARATFRADASERALRLRVEVTDNVHHVATATQAILDGDALELGWRRADGAVARLELAGKPGAAPRVGGNAPAGALREATIRREGTLTTYELVLGWKEMGLRRVDLAQGLRFNFAVHDNDGEGAKSWIAPMPGLGGAERFDASQFPLLRLQ
mgnify:CR=1 FL=1